MGVITLTTDFGLDDPYVGIMKGVILTINPKATVVDVSHAIEPQNIHQAAFILSTAYPYFPQGTIHVVVVDPGVGSERRAVILKTATGYFVAPDNGVLSYVLFPHSYQAGGLDLDIKERRLSPGLEAVAITNPRFFRHPVSTTFHGRDIFAPVAAYLSLGVSPYEFGEVVPSLLAFFPCQPQLEGDAIMGHIIHIDRFGNLVTDINGDLVREDISIEVCGHGIEGLSTCYSEASEGNELLALVGSTGSVEIAAKNKSAAEMLKAKIGAAVRVKIKG
jgi:hypothetical protein